MQLRTRGELHLLKEIRRRFSSAPQTQDSGIIIGIGDDAAVVDPQGKKILVTTDMMSEGIHFDLDFTDPFPLGFKLVSVNVSDIFAMGGRPRHLFLNISMRKDADEGFFWRLYEGIGAALETYGVNLLGGDLSAAENDMVLSATVLGTGDRVITRGGASVGDRIYVTAPTGDSACGLEILKRLTPESRTKVRSEKFEVGSEKNKKELQMLIESSLVTLDWNRVEPLLRRHLMPVARESSWLLPYATSMIDVSDGLFIDLCRICDESAVGARVYLDRIPLSDELKYAAESMGLDPLSLAVSGGEDYELLFTSPEGGLHNAFCIGEIIEKDRIVVDREGRESALKGEGYQHFGSS